MTNAAKIVLKLADAVEKMAMAMPPPNPYTPRFVQIANAARAALHAMGGR
jgi:hypothetical protein